MLPVPLFQYPPAPIEGSLRAIRHRATGTRTWASHSHFRLFFTPSLPTHLLLLLALEQHKSPDNTWLSVGGRQGRWGPWPPVLVPCCYHHCYSHNECCYWGTEHLEHAAGHCDLVAQGSNVAGHSDLTSPGCWLGLPTGCSSCAAGLHRVGACGTP